MSRALAPFKRKVLKLKRLELTIRVAPHHTYLILVVVMALVLCSPARAMPPRQPAPPAPAVADLTFQRLGVAQGLTHPRVISILQDHRGFLWFGTTAGLNRYDGYTMATLASDTNDPALLRAIIISALAEDHDGWLWVGSNADGLAAYDPRTGRFTRFPHNPQDAGSPSADDVTSLLVDRGGTLWVGTLTGGLNRRDPAGGRFISFRHNPADPASLSSDRVQAVYEDHTGTVWVGTVGGGLDSFDGQTGRFTHYRHDEANPTSLSDDNVTAIHEDHDGRLWVGTQNGLNRFDRASGRFTVYRHDPADPSSLPLNSILSLYEDASGLLWIATDGAGVGYVRLYGWPFRRFVNRAGDPDSLAPGVVRGVAADSDGRVWAGTFGSGLNQLDPHTGQVVHYRHDPANPQSLSDDLVWAVLVDQAGTPWIGTGDGTLNRFDRASGTFHHYSLGPPERNYAIYAIDQDRSGALWVGTFGGGLRRFDPATGALTVYTSDPQVPRSLSSDLVRCVVAAQDGTVWAGTYGGGLNHLDPRTGAVTTYRRNPDDPNSISSDNISAMFEDSAQTLWVGTSAGLNRFDRATGRFTHYTNREGLPGGIVQGIVEADGNLWISTLNGMSRFDPRAATFRSYTARDDILSEGFTGVSLTRAGDGTIYAGGFGGLVAFDPTAFRDEAFAPPVVLTDFRINNQPLTIGADSPLQQPIDETTALTLQEGDRTFSIGFAALDYWAPDRARYRYKLDGVDADWVEVGSERRIITYAGLGPGTYTLHVLAASRDGTWNGPERTIAITIAPFLWEQNSFRLAVIALCGVLVFSLLQFNAYRARARQRQLERQIADRTRELEAAKHQAEAANAAKSLFLATMSHELRTPLNVILGFAQILTRSRDMPSNEQQHLAAIQRSGEHLLSLINSVLDLAKVEAGKATLNETTLDLVRLSNDLELLFRQQAADKGLELRVERDDTVPRYVRADAQKLRQVLVNLLGNAVKFTETGWVTLRVTADHRPPTTEDSGLKIEDSTIGPNETQSSLLSPLASDNRSFVVGRSSLVVFEVEDTGPGIAPDEQAQIFEPFVQTTAGVQVHKGTGLGLAISRQYVQLMGGTLHVQSTPGQGARFTVTVPLAVAAPATAEVQGDSRQILALEPGQPPARILVVDDQQDNRQLLIALLAPLGFELREAADGQEAVAIAQEWQPRLILMDLRMPLLDGDLAAGRIKALANGTPPVIIAVSASSTEDEPAAVLAAGCDDFIRKPFRDSDIFTAIARHLGTRYVYAEASQAVVARSSELRRARIELDAEALAALPADVLNELERSIVDANPELIGQSIAQIRKYDAALADALAAWADRFEHAHMLARIDAARSFHG